MKSDIDQYRNTDTSAAYKVLGNCKTWIHIKPREESESTTLNPLRVDDTQANRFYVSTLIGNMLNNQADKDVGKLEKNKIRKAVDVVFDLPKADRSMLAIVKALQEIEATEVHEHQILLSQVLQKWISGVANTDH